MTFVRNRELAEALAEETGMSLDEARSEVEDVFDEASARVETFDPWYSESFEDDGREGEYRARYS